MKEFDSKKAAKQSARYQVIKGLLISSSYGIIILNIIIIIKNWNNLDKVDTIIFILTTFLLLLSFLHTFK